MYITVALIHDKFNKACKTATAIANYCGPVTTINTTKKTAYYNDNKDETYQKFIATMITDNKL